jgi:hypothetical protein
MTVTAKLRNPKIYGLLLTSIMLIGISLSPVLSSLAVSVTIGSSGTIVSPSHTYPSFVYFADYGGSFGEVLINNLTGVCNTLKAHAVKYAVALVSYWDWEGGAPVLQGDSPNSGYPYCNKITVAQWTSIINQLHNSGILVIASMTDFYTYGSGTEMNLASTYYPQYESAITTVMNLGFDGYCDDIETWVGGVRADHYNFLNNMTVFLHTGSNFANGQPRLSCPTLGDFDACFEDQYVIADYVLVQYYNYFGTQTWWSNPLGYGVGSGYPTYVPKSPIIMLTMVGSKAASLGASGLPSMSTQISDFNSYITSYGHQMLYGFGVFMYEYMSSGDWTPWDPWIATTLPSMGVPPA